jgi:hypothetical protein
VQYRTHRNSLPPQNNEPLRSHGHEPSKLLAQDPLDLIGLFDADGQPDRVDGRFDEDAFGFVTRDEEGLEEGFLRVAVRVSNRVVVVQPSCEQYRERETENGEGQGRTQPRLPGSCASRRPAIMTTFHQPRRQPMHPFELVT